MTTPGLRPVEPTVRRLSDLLRQFPTLDVAPGGTKAGDPGAVVLTGVTLDSRSVRPGDVYAALPGARTHGARFVADAVAAGAAAVLTDMTGWELAADTTVPVIVSTDPRAELGSLSSWVYGDPTTRLRLLGVTGTNGKTTVTYLVDAGLRGAGETTGLVGTVETRVAGHTLPSTRTTPEAPDLQGLFAAMVEQGVTTAAMEVSSHALALHRVDGSSFRAAAFTNLSQDHLDFHADMDAYFEAKAMLFHPERSEVAVVDVDDPAGARLAARRPGTVTVSGTGRTPAAWWVSDVDAAPGGSTFVLHGPGGIAQPVSVPLPGTFNVANAALALVLLAASGVALEAAAGGIAALTGVPGRMEKVDAGQPFLAVVDYAHTPAAVETLLASVRRVVTGRIVVVLGCGGDRDPYKRPLMGAAAAAGADVAVLTSDNPRSEDPVGILDAMVEGVGQVPTAQRAEIVVEADRALAIRIAVGRARAGDAVVVAGKGHETGQDVAGIVTPFDDRLILRESLVAVSDGSAAP